MWKQLTEVKCNQSNLKIVLKSRSFLHLMFFWSLSSKQLEYNNRIHFTPVDKGIFSFNKPNKNAQKSKRSEIKKLKGLFLF